MMKGVLKIALLISILIASQVVFGQSSIDKTSFFSAMASSNTRLMDAQLNTLKGFSGNEKEAFEGAMLMKKSGTLSVPAKKLAMFKQGYKKLETAIGHNPGNAEYRFLRLMVQENAPRSLGYYKNIVSDSKMVKESYKRLSTVTQKGIASYSKKSKALAGAF